MPTILLIDDDAQVRTLLRNRLAAAGHTVLEATDAEDGLSRYQATPTDLVLTDLVLPGTSGQHLITELLLHNPDARVIAISGAFDQDVQLLLQEAALRGAVSTLAKPFTTQQLLDAVETALG